MIRIRQVSRFDVGEFWEQILPGLKESVKKSRGNDATIKRVREYLDLGLWELWLVSDEGLSAFAVTEPLPDDHGWVVNIPFAWSSGRTGEVIEKFFAHITPLAEAAGARGIVFATHRVGFDRLAQRKGWKKALTQYVVAEFKER